MIVAVVAGDVKAVVMKALSGYYFVASPPKTPDDIARDWPSDAVIYSGVADVTTAAQLPRKRPR